MRAQAAKAAEDATTGTVSEGSLSSPPDLELHLTLDFYFVYEFHLTLLGSLRELTARATERPLDLYSKYEFHFTLIELPSLRGAHGAGCKAASQTSTSCTGPTSRSGRFTSISKSFTGRGGPNRPGRCTAAYLRAARGLSSQKHDFAAEGHSRTPCRWCRSQLPDFYFRNDWSL